MNQVGEFIYLSHYFTYGYYSHFDYQSKHHLQNLKYHASWVKNSKNAEQCLKILFSVLMAQRKAIYGYDVGSWLVM